MELDVLRVYAGSFISEMDLAKNDKIDLINYVREADEYDIMALLTDGIVPQEWDEDYLIQLEGEMVVLDEQILAMEQVLLEVSFKGAGEKVKKAGAAAGRGAKAAFGGAMKGGAAAGRGIKKGSVAAAGGVKKGGAAAGRGIAKGSKAAYGGAKKGGAAAYGGMKKGAGATKDWAKANPKKAIAAGIGVGALGAAAAYKARQRSKAKKAAAEEEG